MKTRMITASLCLLWIAGSALAEPAQQGGPAIPEAVLKAMAGGGMKPDSDGPGLPKFEDVTKDMQSTKGLFTLWSYGPDAKDKDHEKLLCQIPSGFLGEKFMLSSSFSGGGFFTGFPLDERVVQWELHDKQLVLIEPETQFVADRNQTVSDVVKRTYPERIRAAVPVITKSPSGDPLFDLGALLKTDFADISWMSYMDGGMPRMGSGINASLSKWTKKKTFELNVEIGVELAISRGSPPGSYDKKLVHYSFWKLPASNYTPRVADDRVGYFLTANQDWAKPTESRDLFNRYIDRWNLEKRDSSLPMCEPKQPIVYYIEKTVPVKFRRAVRDGILEWNKAYEKIGFINAVEVRQQTDDNEWKDLDPEDMRFSFFRWIVTGAGFAMGPHRANPFTGQIYDADIIFDDSMVRYYDTDAREMLPSALVQRKLRDPSLSEFFQKFPECRRPVSTEGFSFGDAADPKLRDAMLARMRQRGYHCCDYADGMKHEVALGHTFLMGQPPEVIDRLLYDVVKEVVMHEVGHTLGLRHNFKASSVWTLEEVKERRDKGLALVGSVMDYNPTLFFKEKTTEGAFITPTIGPYDYWAIEYGYRPANGTQPKSETAKEPAKDEKKKETKEETSVAVNDDIPKEVLEKLPPEVRKMIAAGGIVKSGPGGGAPKAAPAAPPVSANPAETEMLRKIASRAAEPELAYLSDEDTTMLSPDPRSNRFDMGKHPTEWAECRLELVDSRLKNILEWAVKENESWYHLRGTFVRLLFERLQILDYVGRYIGGQYTSRSHRGDPDEVSPFELVDPKTQRDALAFIEKHLFSDDYFTVSPDVLNHLAASRWWHAGSFVSFQVDFPYYEYVGMMQWSNLFDRLFPNTLRRIHDAELKATGEDRFTVAEYIQRLQQACWADTADTSRAGNGEWSNAKPFITSIRRSLQREYLNVVEPLVRIPPGMLLTPDIHSMMQHGLRTLSDEIEQVLEAKKLDFASRAHLASCKSRIDRMLTPKLDEYVPRGPAGMMGM